MKMEMDLLNASLELVSDSIFAEVNKIIARLRLWLSFRAMEESTTLAQD